MGRETKIGLFALLIMLCAYFGINFLKGKDLLSSKNTYYALYDDVSGLKTSSPVLIHGVKVGIVSDIAFDEGAGGKIRVSLNVARKYGVPENSCARLFSEGIMGGMAVELELGDSENMLKNRDCIATRNDGDLLAGIGDGAGNLMDEIGKAVRGISSAVRSIDTLVARNTDAIGATLGSLQDIAARLDRIVADEQEQIRSIIEGAGSFADNLKNNSERIDAVVANVQGITDSLRASQLRAVVDNLAVTVAEVNTALEKINSGDGTVARLMNDGNMYRSLAESADNLAALLEDIKAHPSRYINVTVFGRKDKSREDR